MNTPRWEYGWLSAASRNGLYSALYWMPAGEDTVALVDDESHPARAVNPGGDRDNDVRDVRSDYVKLLGEQGWELVSVTAHSWYFKRLMVD